MVDKQSKYDVIMEAISGTKNAKTMKTARQASMSAQQLASSLDWVYRASEKGQKMDDSVDSRSATEMRRIAAIVGDLQEVAEKIAIKMDPKIKFMNKSWRWQ